MFVHQKKILVLAGPSGVGKSTLAHIVLSHFDCFEFSISATTRAPRLQEQDAVDYYFLSEAEFRNRIQSDAFVEWEEVYPGRLYGTLRSEVDRISSAGNIAIFDIDVLGALNIKQQFQDDVAIVFVKPESLDALKIRLMNRGSETSEQIQTRIDRFEKELSYQEQFDYILVNKTGDIDSAKKDIMNFVNTYVI